MLRHCFGTFSPGKANTAIPGDPKRPAPHLRQWITYLSLYRAAVNGVGLVIPINEPMDKLSACVSLAITQNAILGIGSFTAPMGKLEQPEMTAVEVVVMAAGKYGLTIMEGVVFEEQYRKEKAARLPTPPF